MAVFSSTCSYVNLILKQGEIFRNPEILGNPLCSPQEIRLRQCCLCLPKPIEASRRFPPVHVGFGLDPSSFWKQSTGYVLCKNQAGPWQSPHFGSFVLSGTFGAHITLAGVGSPECSVLLGHTYQGFYLPFSPQNR